MSQCVVIDQTPVTLNSIVLIRCGCYISLFYGFMYSLSYVYCEFV
jgi:hypothetical protein